MEEINVSAGTKKEQYEQSLPQIQALVNDETNPVANMANIVAALKQTLAYYSWVGFYLFDSKSNELVLGPFQGKVACTRIAIGKGVCGTSFQRKETIIVPDVDKFPGHIYCDGGSKSEIVVPILHKERIIGVLDVDSYSYNSFDEVDKTISSSWFLKLYIKLYSNMTKPKLNKAPKAYKNAGFLSGKDARPLRILSEFLEPLSRFTYYGVKDTIVFFGSARIKPRSETIKNLRKLAKNGTKDKVHSKKYHEKLLQAEIAVEMSRYYEDATELSRLITVWSKKLKMKDRLLVCSGGGPGIMEAANKGAKLAKGESIGMNISLPFEQYPNQYITPKFNFDFHYFFMRKFWFMFLGKGLVAFPGGFGTLDEFFELLTLLQTQKVGKKMSVILYGENFWKKIIDFRALVNNGMISEADLNLFSYADTPKQAFNILTTSLKNNYPEFR